MKKAIEHKRIWLSSPHMGEKELEYVKRTFADNWIAPVGPYLTEFEHLLESRISRMKVAALQSGTASLHLALRLLNIEKDDIILCQSLTFIGSVYPILYEKATPVFIDSETVTWNICPQALEDSIKYYIEKNKKPKAIIVVHLYGMPAQMEELMSLSHKYDIPILEDAAEALGSHIKGKPCGSYGEMSILSFNGNKIITTSGGGALASDNPAYIEKAKYLATQAKQPYPHYEHTEIGYNYRLSNVCAAIGVGQLNVLDERIEQRRANYNFYLDLLQDYPEITFLKEPKGYFSNRWLSCLLIDFDDSSTITPETLRLYLEKYNIESRPLWKPMHKQPLLEKFPFFGSTNAEEIFSKGLCLPSGSNLTLVEKNRIQTHLNDFLNDDN